MQIFIRANLVLNCSGRAGKPGATLVLVIDTAFVAGTCKNQMLCRCNVAI